MTFILGIKSDDGLVLCSDSLESDGYSKSHVRKLYQFTPEGKDWKDPRWGIAWGCSGDAPVIKRFSDKLLDLLRNEKPAYERHRLEELVESLVRKMHEDYSNERLSVVLALWGVVFWGEPDQRNKHERRLYFVNERSDCLSVEERFALAGMDTSLARFLLESILTDDATTGDALYLASFVTSVMKEKADGVGGPTQMLFYPYFSGNPPVTPPRWIEALKGKIAEFESTIFSIGEVEQAIRQFCWSRFPHKFRPSAKSAGQS